MNIQSPRLLSDIATNSLRLPESARPDPLALLAVADAKVGTFPAELAAKARNPALPEAPEPSGRGAYRIAERSPAIMRQQPQPPSESDWLIASHDDEPAPTAASTTASPRHVDTAEAPSTLHNTRAIDPPAPQ
ncbi:MAG: hypothetical protein JWL62_3076, partial [Hyphomicrobiales bacterium]|nr:hypothetical protein [Hyphomicrobiales bacterium]